MTDEEKILKFAGFTAKQIYVQDIPDVEVTGPEGWDGKEPDTADLTWLFKWCVPKLLEVYGKQQLRILLEQWIHWALEEGKAPTGEALRAAILALIGEGE